MGSSNSKPRPVTVKDIEGITLATTDVVPNKTTSPEEARSHPRERSIQSDSLWKDQTALIFIVRRPGCALCREEALDLKTNAAEIKEKHGIKMVAVCHERLGVDEFARDYWDFGDIYIDEAMGFFKALGGGEERTLGYVGMFNPTTISKYRKASGRAPGNFQGNGSILGGLLIVAKGGEKILFQHSEGAFGDRADIKDVLDEIRNEHGHDEST